jgi:cobalt-precorrin 5A hydrolase
MSRAVGLATVDIKANERGLLRFSELSGLPIAFYSAEQLNSVEGNFTESEFVNRITGSGSVCERAAALRGGKGKFVLRKTVGNGVAVAAFEADLC